MRNIFNVFLLIAFLSFVTSCDFIRKQGNNVTNEQAKVPPRSVDKSRNVDNLHPDAKKYIDDFLPGHEIARVIVYDSEYKVWLTTGELLEFNLEGEIQEIESASGVPESVIDARVLEDVKSIDPQATIVKIEKKSDGGYEVKLDTGKEILYDVGYQKVGFDED